MKKTCYLCVSVAWMLVLDGFSISVTADLLRISHTTDSKVCTGQCGKTENVQQADGSLAEKNTIKSQAIMSEKHTQNTGT